MQPREPVRALASADGSQRQGWSGPAGQLNRHNDRHHHDHTQASLFQWLIQSFNYTLNILAPYKLYE